MGCGGSSTFAEDGSIAPGKGEVAIAWSAEKPVEVGFYYYTEKDATILVKEFPMDKECAEKQFETNQVVSSSGGVHWVKVVPGTRYAMKYVEGGHSAAFPNQKALELPKKIHEFHTKDDAAKDKLVTDLKKDVEKEEGHAYNAEGADDKIKADIDAIGGLTTCADLPDEMGPFKKACKVVEDLQPWNTINPVLALKTEFGHWEEKEGKLARQLGLVDKGKVMAEAEVAKKGPQVPHKGLSTAQNVFGKVIDGAVKGGCKKAGPEADVLAANLADRIDNMDGCTPGVDRAAEKKLPEPKEGEEKKEEEKKEEEEGDPLEKAGKEEYEADKGKLDDLKADDGKDYKDEAVSYLKAVYGSISNVDAAADANKAVVANVKGFQVPAFIDSVEGDDVNVSYPVNNWQDAATGKITKQVDGTNVNGTTAEELKIDAFTSLPAANDEFLERGQAVTVKNDREFYQGWVKSVDGDTVNIEDQLMVPRTAKKEDVFTHLTQQSLASKGVGLVPNFAPLTFTWVAAEDENITVRKVKVWRFGAPDSAQEYDLKAVKAKAKPSKENKEPTHEVHVGFTAEVPILLGAKYAYNFQIGDSTYVDWEKKIEGEAAGNACKVFTCNARVEY